VNFGRQLRRLRAKESRGAVCRALARWGLTLDRSTLLQYERGTVAAPDPGILWALGRHYGLTTVDELLTVLVMDRTGRKLRDGVEIAVPGLTHQQRFIAELFGTFSPEWQTALTTIFVGLHSGDVSFPGLQRPRRAKRAAAS
jgi:hypothetical protein